MSLLKTNETTTIDLMELLPKDYDKTPKIGANVKPSDCATFFKVAKGVLRKIQHYDPTMTRGVGMLEVLCEDAEWTADVSDINAKRTGGTPSPPAHTYPTIPNPGDEPAAPKSTDTSSTVSALVAERKIWKEKCEAKQCRDAVEMGLLQLIADQFPTCSQRLFDDSGFFPCDLTAIDVWKKIKSSVFVEAKVDKEVMDSHDEIKKLKPSHALGTESHL